MYLNNVKMDNTINGLLYIVGHAFNTGTVAKRNYMICMDVIIARLIHTAMNDHLIQDSLSLLTTDRRDLSWMVIALEVLVFRDQ